LKRTTLKKVMAVEGEERLAQCRLTGRAEEEELEPSSVVEEEG
jgi:hypothetical protein